MDKRNRPACKRYRNNTDIKFVTISLNFEENILKKIENQISLEPDKNMSRFIEDAVSPFLTKNIFENSSRRNSCKNFVKKTFTFSVPFATELKKYQNMSLYVNAVLRQVFRDE